MSSENDKWDDADFAARLNAKEMDDFLKFCEDNPATSQEDQEQRMQRFSEIFKRENDIAMAIAERTKVDDSGLN